MDWEVYPEAIYQMIKKFSAYKEVKKIIITENGAAFDDKLENNHVNDHERIHFLSNYIAQVYRAKKEGYKYMGISSGLLLIILSGQKDITHVSG